MASRGVCEICGLKDDSYRIEENGAVMKVCKLCYDGYLERTGAHSAEPVAAGKIDLPFDDIPPDDLKEIERELELQKKERKVQTLDSSQLSQVLDPTEDDKKVLSNVRRRQIRAEKRAARTGEQLAWEDSGEDDDEEPEEEIPVILPDKDIKKKKDKKRVSRAEKNIAKIREEAAEQQKLLRTRIQGILDTLEIDGVLDDEPKTEEQTDPENEAEQEFAATAKEQEPIAEDVAEKNEAEPAEPNIVAQEESAAPQETVAEEDTSQKEEEKATQPSEKNSEPEAEEAQEPIEEAAAEAKAELKPEPEEAALAPEEAEEAQEPIEEAAAETKAAHESEPENVPLAPEEAEEAQEPIEEAAADTKTEPEPEPEEAALPHEENEMAKQKVDSKKARVQEKILAEANQTIDDERIKITSPEIAVSKDTRPKTNLDVAISEYTGGVRFLNAFKYVMHRVSYTVFLALVVLAVSTVMYVLEGWQKALIVFGGGLGAIGLGFLLMWYLSHCYELDKRAYLLRIRQQEILFESSKTACYRELRTKFTIIKALGWLLNKLTVLLPLVAVVGGNIAAVLVTFTVSNMYWLFPIISAGASVGAVVIYYVMKFCADCVAYALDRERNQQIQQQTLLDILDELRKDK